jgi:cysteine desulfurase family protein (TIGR01976 family)
MPISVKPLDIDHVRAQFPGLASRWAFLDNAGGSQVLRTVAERISDYLLTTSVQTGASYAVSQKATARLGEARGKIARLLNAARPEEIVLGPSTSVMLRFLALAMASQLQAGDEVILTDFDHESNIGPWHRLKDRGVVFKTWRIDPQTFAVNLGDLERLMTKRTKLLCMTHASNILGTINPVAEAARIAHANGARICVDGVAFAPHRAVDVQALDVDYYAFSFYKTFGPHFAVLYGKHAHLTELDGLYHYFYGRDKVPGKLEPGNPNYELAWGCAGIVDYLDSLGAGDGSRASIDQAFAAIAQHEETLSQRLLTWLNRRNDIRVIGSREPDRAVRVPTIAFKVEGRDSMEIVQGTDSDFIGIRHGDFHSRGLVERLGLAAGNGVLRASMVHYNTIEEVDRLIVSLERALA